MKTICVYCGSSDKVNPIYLQAAYQMGEVLAERGLELVYGAGKTGLMGAVAEGALSAGGRVTGVITEQFYTPQLAHMKLTRLEIAPDMHTRKRRLVELADGFIALPGGYGTFDELFEILTWAQIGLHSKAIGLLNVQAYFDPLLAMVEHARREGFIYDEHRALFSHSSDPGELLELLEGYTLPSELARWVEREE